MKITIELDTKDLKKEDLELLRSIGNYSIKESRMETEPTSVSPLQPEKPLKWKKGLMKECILDTVVKNDGLTVAEIKRKTGYSPAAIGLKLRELVSEKKVERSDTKPYIFYERGNNADLKEALKNTDKVAVMG